MDNAFWKTFVLGGAGAFVLLVLLHKLGWE